MLKLSKAEKVIYVPFNEMVNGKEKELYKAVERVKREELKREINKILGRYHFIYPELSYLVIPFLLDLFYNYKVVVVGEEEARAVIEEMLDMPPIVVWDGCMSVPENVEVERSAIKSVKWRRVQVDYKMVEFEVSKKKAKGEELEMFPPHIAVLQLMEKMKGEKKVVEIHPETRALLYSTTYCGEEDTLGEDIGENVIIPSTPRKEKVSRFFAPHYEEGKFSVTLNYPALFFAKLGFFSKYFFYQIGEEEFLTVKKQKLDPLKGSTSELAKHPRHVPHDQILFLLNAKEKFEKLAREYKDVIKPLVYNIAVLSDHFYDDEIAYFCILAMTYLLNFIAFFPKPMKELIEGKINEITVWFY